MGPLEVADFSAARRADGGGFDRRPPLLLLALVGPPLSGKTTLARRLVAAEDGLSCFGVRSHFEPLRLRPWLRPDLRLPPLGSLLSDATVLRELLASLRSSPGRRGWILDGLPTTASQARAIAALARDAGAALAFAFLGVDRREAARRAGSRMVCMTCDGGSAPVTAAPSCPTCRTTPMRRPDDTPDGFRARWQAYEDREEMLFATCRFLSDGVCLPAAARHLLERLDPILGLRRVCAGRGDDLLP